MLSTVLLGVLLYLAKETPNALIQLPTVSLKAD